MRLAGLLVKVLALKAILATMDDAPISAVAKGADTPPPSPKPDSPVDYGALIDRIATRFGAFAIVATIAYPVWQAADGLLLARRHDLPDLVGQGFTVWSSIVLGAVLALFAVGLGFSVFTPVLRVFDRMTSAARWFVAIPLGLAMLICFVAYVVLMVAVFTGDALKPVYSDLAQSLRHMPICQELRLDGQICQDVLHACSGQRADFLVCRDIAREHIERIRPVVGAFR